MILSSNTKSYMDFAADLSKLKFSKGKLVSPWEPQTWNCLVEAVDIASLDRCETGQEVIYIRENRFVFYEMVHSKPVLYRPNDVNLIFVY